MAGGALGINRDIFVLIVASLLLLFFKFIDWLNFYSGVIFLLILFSYISYSYFQDQKDNGDKEENLENFSLIKAIIYSVIGLATLILGGWLLVNSSIKIAQSYGISEAVIGLTIVAVGTAIPELTTTIIASIKKHNDLVIGNILGSNIFNILGILGVTLLIENIPVTDEMMKKGIWEMITNEEIVNSYNTYVDNFNEVNKLKIEEGSISALSHSSEEFIAKASGIKTRRIIDKKNSLDPCWIN